MEHVLHHALTLLAMFPEFAIAGEACSNVDYTEDLLTPERGFKWLTVQQPGSFSTGRVVYLDDLERESSGWSKIFLLDTNHLGQEVAHAPNDSWDWMNRCGMELLPERIIFSGQDVFTVARFSSDTERWADTVEQLGEWFSAGESFSTGIPSGVGLNPTLLMLYVEAIDALMTQSFRLSWATDIGHIPPEADRADYYEQAEGLGRIALGLVIDLAGLILTGMLHVLNPPLSGFDSTLDECGQNCCHVKVALKWKCKVTSVLGAYSAGVNDVLIGLLRQGTPVGTVAGCGTGEFVGGCFMDLPGVGTSEEDNWSRNVGGWQTPEECS